MKLLVYSLLLMNVNVKFLNYALALTGENQELLKKLASIST